MPAASGASGPTTVSATSFCLANLISCGKSVGLIVHVLGVFGGPGIARRHEHPLHARTLRNLPRQGMFATAVAND